MFSFQFLRGRSNLFLPSKDQGSKGIRQWPINLCTFPKVIYKIPSFLDNNYWLKRLDTQLNETTNQKSFKVPKVIKPMNKKTLIKLI